MKKLTVLLALVLSVLLPALAVAEEAEPTPAPVPAEEIMAYAQVYEPETSFVLSSTVAWNADASVLDVANADVRPATALVYVDAGLRVLDAAGNVISEIPRRVRGRHRRHHHPGAVRLRRGDRRGAEVLPHRVRPGRRVRGRLP